MILMVDYDDAILANEEENVHLNSHLFDREDAIAIRRLDWTKHNYFLKHNNKNESWESANTEYGKGKYCWSREDLQELGNVQILLAADGTDLPSLLMATT